MKCVHSINKFLRTNLGNLSVEDILGFERCYLLGVILIFKAHQTALQKPEILRVIYTNCPQDIPDLIFVNLDNAQEHHDRRQSSYTFLNKAICMTLLFCLQLIICFTII
jgi:hypothetical protein